VPGDFPPTAAACNCSSVLLRCWHTARSTGFALTPEQRRDITHVIVTSCTGLYAPGLDFEVVSHLGLSPSVERTMIGFMGCYAAINALKSAHHIVRSEPMRRCLSSISNSVRCIFRKRTIGAGALVFLVFADGCAASLVSAQPHGLAIDSFLAVQIPLRAT